MWGETSRSVSALHRHTYMAGSRRSVTNCNVGMLRMVRNINHASAPALRQPVAVGIVAGSIGSSRRGAGQAMLTATDRFTEEETADARDPDLRPLCGNRLQPAHPAPAAPPRPT